MPNVYPKFYGLDWGFSGDPLALVECEQHNRSLWLNELLYEHNLTNDDLERHLLRLKISKSAPIVADSAQPKDIEHMRRRGWNFIAAVKGTGSVKSGISFINQYDVYLTESSKNFWKENENYAWALDQYKEPTDEPIDRWNHLCDATNYAMDRVRKPAGVAIHSSVVKKVSNGRSVYNM
jgi:phage terminase large subunit